MKRIGLYLLVCAVLAVPASGQEVGFIEDFALAKDRSTSLRQLIPGTEDYYYYHCLHYLNSEQFEKAEEFTRPWLQRFGRTQRLIEIQTRHAILTYDRNPQQSLRYLRDRLNLRFDHQKEILGAVPNLPISLDPDVISRRTLRAYSLRNWQNLDNFEDSALDWLATEELGWERRRNLLQRLGRPDISILPRLIDEDLRSPHPQAFGAFAIHRQLTLVQLRELVRLRPELLNQTAFVQAWVSKLHPGADADWRHDANLMRAYLDALQEFVGRLAPAHNSLKAHVLYQRLVFDRSQGVQNKDLFLEYLKLPRRQAYMSRALLEREESQRFPADLQADFSGVTLLPVIGADEELVRSYLKHFLMTADSPREFEPFINDIYLRHILAETKIENGLGDAEQWASQLPPELFRRLKDRIDIDFAATNKTSFTASEPVRLDLFVKNVPNLLVKVFEINTVNYYRSQQREVDTDINLDGLIANTEQTHEYAEPALRRMARRFEFPELTRPGVFVIDFIGNGKSSRALIRKGRIRPIVVQGTAGLVITAVDDANNPLKDVSAWLGGVEYPPDKDGRIILPYSTSPSRQPIVLRRGDFACLEFLQHQAESYEFRAGIHVDREALLTQRQAQVLIRPGLYLNGTPVSIKLLEDVRLRIIATDHSGIPTSTEIPNFKLYEDRESIHDFRVPARLASLSISLHAKVKSLSLNKTLDLASSQSFALNEIEKTERIEDLHLARFGSNYVIELLGRTGEAGAHRPIQLAFKHRDFRQPVHATLKTDEQGRVHLGRLTDIVSLTATGPEGTAHTWTLPLDRHSYRQLVHARAGEPVSLPYMGTAAKPDRTELALFEVLGGNIRADRFDSLSIRGGMLELHDLPPGDFDLWLKQSGERVRIRIVDGSVQGRFVLGKLRHLELPALKAVQIAAIEAAQEDLTIRLRDASAFTRVHLFATRYQPNFSAFANLGKITDAELSGVYPAHAETIYLTGRNIGDEYRYVLDRRGQKKFPGNMLDRPGLLLNPWAIRSTETREQLAELGEGFGARGQPAPAAAAPRPEGQESRLAPPGDFANLDFLADASAVIINLVPDKEGNIRIKRKEIGPHAMVHVVAVDPLSTTYRTIGLPESPAQFVDLRLRQGLDPKGRFTQQKQTNVLTVNQPFTIPDVAASRFEAYDSLRKVYGLYATISKDANLTEFAFLLNWPKLKADEKQTLYSKYACHELNFFVFKKDPEFFRSVVRPYLANKKDKTFMDRWLLEDDLTEYLQPWRYGRLNAVERILLAQRIKEESAKTARHLNDLLRLQPPNPDRIRYLFETTVKRGSLETDDALGFTKAKDAALQDMIQHLKKRAGATAGDAPPMQPGGGGGFGGGAAGAMGRSARVPASRKEQAAARDKEAAELKALDEVEREKVANGKADYRRSLRQREQLHFGQDRANALVRQLYRPVDVTMEWAENNYYHLPIGQQLADLVSVSAFWLDYARHDPSAPFLSRHFNDASRNFTEMVLALSLLDLPFEAPKHLVAFKEGGMTLTPAGAVIAVHEQVRRVDDAPGQGLILIGQNMFRQGDRYRDEGGERFDKFVTGEFLVRTVYGCQVVVTNPTSAKQRLSLLLQLPVGAIPVGNGQFTKTVLLDLEPYRTHAIEYLFYFPLPGKFAHFPVQAAKNERIVAAAAPVTFEVVEKPSRIDTGSWEYVSQHGSDEQVLAMLGRENLHALNLDKIAFRMRDKAFCETVLRLLGERHVFQATLWSYALNHNLTAAAQQYLLHSEQIVAECGGPIRGPLLTIDPTVRGQYEHLEYKPLVNARAHPLGARRHIVNARLYAQYHKFLKLLSYRQQLSDEDKLAVVYYLLVQDRVDEAIATFTQVNPDAVATRVQYDYCAAYLDGFSDEPQKAGAIAAKYANHPVNRWRNNFTALMQQIDEAVGKESKVVDLENRDQRQGLLAATEPSFSFTLDARQIHLAWQTITEVRVNYYLMDVELLFSRNPFVQEVSGPFASIRPNATQVVSLPTGRSKLDLPLPDNLVSRNLLVEITAAGKTRSIPYYANAMDVRMLENYGQVRISNAGSGKPLPKVYVKVYARLADGTVKFHKDGYTDHRGRFDYASVSTPYVQPANRYAVLVLSEDQGATIRETAPPQR